jgi:hypothetical protein
MQEIVDWAKAHPAIEDLVILGVAGCDGVDSSKQPCINALRELFISMNVTFVEDCSSLKGLTVSEAARMGQLPTGGSLLALNGCWVQHYKPSVTCYGDNYTCYASSSTKSEPLGHMWDYLDSVTAAGYPANGDLYTYQALWEEDASTVIFGDLHASSLILDESRSQLNSLVMAAVKSGRLPIATLSMVELNNVCDGGPALLQLLRSFN